MAIKESLGTSPGTHPSFASSCTRVECDRCGKKFRADCRVGGRWMLHGKHVGLTDYSGGGAEELCAECEAEVFED